jgi:hypothetical protein
MVNFETEVDTATGELKLVVKLPAALETVVP